MPLCSHAQSVRNRCVVVSMVVLLLCPVLSYGQTASGSEASLTRRKQALQETLQILIPSRPPHAGRINAIDKTWEEWQKRTGELPPDFAAMPSLPDLPDPFAAVIEGKGSSQQTGAVRVQAVRDASGWEQKRTWIAEQAQQWLYGKLPPAPDNLIAERISEEMAGDLRIEKVLLRFGPERKGELLLEIATPPGKGPFPVFLTNHPRWRPWAATAVRRGYIGVFYSASDPNYAIKDYSDGLIEVYPDYDFSTIARWGWSASRAIDYLYTLPQVNRAQIGITGHSRNGKQALMAAAFDKRIGAVILSSGNTGESNPWRYTTDIYSNETIEQITGNFPHWFHPRLRFFAGREDKLPIDQNLVMSMVAPRGLMIASAYSEGQGAPYGIERGYRSVQRVYRLLGAEDKVTLQLRAGEHATTAGDIEEYVDFLDHVFGRPGGHRPETLTLDYQHQRWEKETAARRTAPKQMVAPINISRALPTDQAGWTKQKSDIRAALQTLLGDEPAALPFELAPGGKPSTYPNDGWLSGLFQRPLHGKNFTWEAVGFGDDLRADLYRPTTASADAKLPVVIWLHQEAHPTGYSRHFRSLLDQLIAKGFAVMAFDQIGFGSRIHQANPFYRRYPAWSLMGKMVADARAAVDMAGRIPGVDGKRIYLAGWSLGARVAMYAGAMDPDKIAGVAMVAGFRPQRPESPEQTRELQATEGLAQYGRWQGILPQLTEFERNPQRLPIDDPEVLALLSPKPVLVVAPTRDRYASPTLLRIGLERVQATYRSLGNESAVSVKEPLDFNRFPKETQEQLATWLASTATKEAKE